MNQGADATILAQQLKLHILDVRLRIIDSIGVQAGEHGVDSFLHRGTRVHIVHIVDIQRLIEAAENFEVLRQFEATVGRSLGREMVGS